MRPFKAWGWVPRAIRPWKTIFVVKTYRECVFLCALVTNHNALNSFKLRASSRKFVAPGTSGLKFGYIPVEVHIYNILEHRWNPGGGTKSYDSCRAKLSMCEKLNFFFETNFISHWNTPKALKSQLCYSRDSRCCKCRLLRIISMRPQVKMKTFSWWNADWFA